MYVNKEHNENNGLTRMICGIYVKLSDYRSQIFIDNTEIFVDIIDQIIPLIGSNKSVDVKYGTKTLQDIMLNLLKYIELDTYSVFVKHLVNIFHHKNNKWSHSNKGKSEYAFLSTFNNIVIKLAKKRAFKMIHSTKDEHKNDILFNEPANKEIYKSLLTLFGKNEKDTIHCKFTMVCHLYISHYILNVYILNSAKKSQF